MPCTGLLDTRSDESKIIHKKSFFLGCLMSDAPESPSFSYVRFAPVYYRPYTDTRLSLPQTKYARQANYTCLYPHDPPRTNQSICDPSTGQFVPATITLDCHHEPCLDPPPTQSGANCSEVDLPATWPTEAECLCPFYHNLCTRSSRCNVTGQWDPPSFKPCIINSTCIIITN